MTLTTSTLRPGLLVSLKTSINGNINYSKTMLEPDRATEDGSRVAKWETERVIMDPVERENAVKARSKAAQLIRSVCAHSAFGLLCPEDKREALDSAVADGRELIDAFNATSKLTRVFLYVIAGRIAPDDVEAVKAINSEVRDLMEDMKTGLQNLDVKTVREAASRARNLGSMLSVEAGARVQLAIETARSAAKKIVQTGEEGAVAIDTASIKRLEEMRTSFLDLDDAGEIAAPKENGRAVDLPAWGDQQAVNDLSRGDQDRG